MTRSTWPPWRFLIERRLRPDCYSAGICCHDLSATRWLDPTALFFAGGTPSPNLVALSPSFPERRRVRDTQYFIVSKCGLLHVSRTEEVLVPETCGYSQQELLYRISICSTQLKLTSSFESEHRTLGCADTVSRVVSDLNALCCVSETESQLSASLGSSPL